MKVLSSKQKIAETLPLQIDVELGVIDADRYQKDIKDMWSLHMGVPTLFWYEEGEKQFEYFGQRSKEDILHFIKK